MHRVKQNVGKAIVAVHDGALSVFGKPCQRRRQVFLKFGIIAVVRAVDCQIAALHHLRNARIFCRNFRQPLFGLDDVDFLQFAAVGCLGVFFKHLMHFQQRLDDVVPVFQVVGAVNKGLCQIRIAVKFHLHPRKLAVFADIKHPRRIARNLFRQALVPVRLVQQLLLLFGNFRNRPAHRVYRQIVELARRKQPQPRLHRPADMPEVEPVSRRLD